MNARLLAITIFALAGCAAPQQRPAPAPFVVSTSTPVVPSAPEPRRWTGRLPGGTVDLDVKDEPIDKVLAEIGRQRGFPVFVDGGAPDTVTLSVVGAPWRSIVEWLCRVGRLKVASEKGMLVLASTPRNHLSAKDADASAWFRLLAQHSGKSIIMPGNLHATIDADLTDVDFELALEATAKNAGYVVVHGEAGVVVGR